MKYVIFFAAALGVPPLAFLLYINQRWMKYAFFGMIAAMCLYQATAINFFSHEFYPGTARGMEVSLVHLLSFGLLAALALRGGVKKMFPECGYKLYLIYFLVCLPSLSVADDLLISWLEIWKMIMLFIFYLTVYCYLKATDDVDSILKALILLLFVNFFFTAKAHYSGVYQPGGIFPHRNGMAMGMLLLGPVFFAGFLSRGLKSWFGRLCAMSVVCAAISTFWTYSRGALMMVPVAYGIATMACLFERRGTGGKFKRILPLAVIGMIGLAAMLPRIIQRFEEAPKSSGDTRVELAMCAYEMIRAHPITGVGINNWSMNMRPNHQYQDRASDKLGVDLDYRGIVETVYLLVCAECGIPALLMMLVWFFWHWLSCILLLKRLRGTKWYFIPAGLLGGLTANYLQSTLEWVLRQQISLLCLMFMFALISYFNTNWRKLVQIEKQKTTA